jgi:hypothetical protein
MTELYHTFGYVFATYSLEVSFNDTLSGVLIARESPVE